MARTHTYELGAFTFPTLAAIQQHCRAMLAEHPLGSTFDTEETAFLHALLARHPHCAEKVGGGIERFVVLLNAHDAKHFGIIRTDGTVDNFSFVKCTSRLNPNQELTDTLRREVAGQLTKFYFSEVQRRNIVSEKGAWHVHHDPEFSTIWRTWLDARNLNTADIALIEAQSGEGLMLADRELASEWYRYHERHARLYLVPVGVHKELHHPTTTPIAGSPIAAFHGRMQQRGGVWSLRDGGFDITPRAVLSEEDYLFIKANRDALLTHIKTQLGVF